MITKGLMSSNTGEWATPQKFFDEINETYHFQTDVCASPSNAKCTEYFTIAQDGLKQIWKGRVWMNPPYGRTIGLWIKKAAESDATVVALLPARTDTKWFHDFIYRKAKVTFLKGRLKFNDGKKSAPFPSMLVVFGKRRKRRPTAKPAE